LNEFILEDCQKITQNLIYDGKENIDNFEKYTKGIYDKKLKSDYEMSRYRSIYEIKLIIENHINNLKDKFNVSNEKHGILMFTDRLNNIDYESFFVNDQYELIDFATFEKIKLTPEKSLLRLKNAKVSIFNLPKNMKNYSLSSF
jgi:4-alpha-glucanotransferase